MRLNDVALVRLLVFGIILSTVLLGAGCSGGSDSSGGDPSDNLGAPPDPGTISLSCQRLSSAVRVSLSQPYEYEIRLYAPSGSSRSISWGGRITSHSFNYSFDQLGFGNKTFRAVWTYVGSSNNPAFGRQTERQCSVYIPLSALEQPDLYCEYSPGLHQATITVSFGDYDGPFYVDLYDASPAVLGERSTELGLVNALLVSSDGQQFRHFPGLSGRYRYALLDESMRIITICEVNVTPAAPIAAACCRFSSSDPEVDACLGPFGLTYIMPVHIAAEECGQVGWWFGDCAGPSGVFVTLIRGSSAREADWFTMEYYLDEGWLPTFTDWWNPVWIWTGEGCQ